MATAGSQVGSTYELVEHILMHTEPRTLLLAQRVNTTWQAIIQKSTPLQQALFFVPLPLSRGNLRVESSWMGARLPEAAFLGMKDNYALRNLTVFKNPMARPLLDITYKVGYRPVYFYLPKPWWRANASWRKMLLTQPPIITDMKYGISSRRVATWDTGRGRLEDIVRFLDGMSSYTEGLAACSIKYDYRLRSLESASQLLVVEEHINSLESKAEAAKTAGENSDAVLRWRAYAFKLQQSSLGM